MGYIDFHAHLLPGADHGSDSIETSKAQLKLAKEKNISLIVATPHFYPYKHNLAEFLKKRERAVKDIKTIGCDIKILSAAEILICEGFENINGIDTLCIEGTNNLLIELPFSSYRNEYKQSIEALIDKGYGIILAHVDRYDPEIIEDLINLGAKAQVNASALAKPFMKKYVRSLIKRDLVYAIGSDIHNVDKNAYKKYDKARRKLGNQFSTIMKRSSSLLNLSEY